MDLHVSEICKSERFEFGDNWARFLHCLNEERILEAEKSLKLMLNIETLEGKSFLDIGSGSGLFSLAARRLGAKVFSFDYDPQSVACAQELKDRFFSDDDQWVIEEGSALDAEYIQSLGEFDIVYSWGGLHHTGEMWNALKNAAVPVAENGKLFIAIYNDQGGASKRWLFVKKLYNHYALLHFPLACYTVIRQWIVTIIRDTLKGSPLVSWNQYKRNREMSAWRDIIDWVGGYPFEVAKPEEIFEFYHDRGYVLNKLKTCAGGLGCNEFIFQKTNSDDNE